MRKIIHIDMDCFYAAVEERDDPALKGRPVAVAWEGPRGVVLTANYEARTFGVGSALATSSALRKCPQLTLVPPRLDVYRAVSKTVQALFHRYTDLVEPLSLDEAYLDVTLPKQGPPSGTRLAELIRRDVKTATGLSASAGVSYNKFLAKLASGLAKPDGLAVILPQDAQTLLEGLRVEAFHGVGPATAKRLHSLGVYTGADLKRHSLDQLHQQFGRVGEHFYAIVRGQDERPVVADRPHKSISAETTFEVDCHTVAELVPTLYPLAEQVAKRLAKAGLAARVVVVKLKHDDFQVRTRRRTLPYQVTQAEGLRSEAEQLLRTLPLDRGVRLLGVGAAGLSNGVADEPRQPSLFPDHLVSR